jgi:IS30 family transposase
LQWSPEQIAGRLKAQDTLSISHETIYRRIWRDQRTGGALYRELRGAPKQRRKRYGAKDSRGRLAGKRHIDDRPREANERLERGHYWEIDTVMGNHASRHCIVTLNERRTGLCLIGKLPERTKEALNQALLRLMRSHGGPFKTITADNGTEFHGYEAIEKATSVRFYVARPYHSWERGSNENTNGLIRQYLPTRQSMTFVNQNLCDAIADRLNNRPRKRLGYQTPLERTYEK